MILVITTREHAYTHAAVAKERALDVVVVSYEEILRRKRPYRATHIFTDLDRLPAWQVHDAALLFRKLERAGIRALNDPARFRNRFGLLRALNRAGINDFDAYPADSLETPRRWPVFIRLEGNHRAPVSGLLQDQEELDRAIEDAIDKGAPRSSMLILEYCSEPVRPGLFRKLSVFRVGDRLLGYTCVHDDTWLVKYGKAGLAPVELYEEEYSFVETNPFGPAMLNVFNIAGIDYGRVDFGLVGGRPQIYEINSNPMVEPKPPASLMDRRNQSVALFRNNYLEAMEAIDTGRRPAWMRSTGSLVRSTRELPQRARRLAEGTYGKLKGAAARKSGDPISTGA